MRLQIRAVVQYGLDGKDDWQPSSRAAGNDSLPGSHEALERV